MLQMFMSSFVSYTKERFVLRPALYFTESCSVVLIIHHLTNPQAQQSGPDTKIRNQFYRIELFTTNIHVFQDLDGLRPNV